MSSRCSLFTPVISCGGIFVTLAVFVLIILPTALYANPTGDIKIDIDHYHTADSGTYVDIPVTIENNSAYEIYGFDFLIKYVPTVLTLNDITRGQILTDCNWEYFNYRQDVTGLIRVVSMASLGGGPGSSSCYIGNVSGELFNLNFYVDFDPTFYHTLWHIEFYWMECQDNNLTDPLGESAIVSNDVYDGGDFLIPPENILPTNSGTPDSCIFSPTVLQLVDFYQGFITTYYPEIPSRGDLNLNGITNEIADYVLFSTYFIVGLDSFYLDPPEQISRSDINNDGKLLELRDFIYLWRVIIGDVPPYPKTVPLLTDTAVIIQDVGAGTLTLQYSDSLAAGAFRFSGEVIPDQTTINELDIGFGYGTDLQGRVLISSTDQSKPHFWQGQLFTYSGDALLMHAEFADYFDSYIPVRLERINIPWICGDVSGDDLVNLVDITSIVSYIFFGGPAPDPRPTADVNMDGRVNLVDVIYLLTYLFRSGPEPCAGI